MWGRNDGYARGEFDMGAMVRGESAERGVTAGDLLRRYLRWAFDISIIIVDLMYFSAFDVVLTVFQCVLGHSTRST